LPASVALFFLRPRKQCRRFSVGHYSALVFIAGEAFKSFGKVGEENVLPILYVNAVSSALMIKLTVDTDGLL
jgi:hypothetical protein